MPPLAPFGEKRCEPSARGPMTSGRWRLRRSSGRPQPQQAGLLHLGLRKLLPGPPPGEGALPHLHAEEPRASGTLHRARPRDTLLPSVGKDPLRVGGQWATSSGGTVPGGTDEEQGRSPRHARAPLRPWEARSLPSAVAGPPSCRHSGGPRSWAPPASLQPPPAFPGPPCPAPVRLSRRVSLTQTPTVGFRARQGPSHLQSRVPPHPPTPFPKEGCPHLFQG